MITAQDVRIAQFQLNETKNERIERLFQLCRELADAVNNVNRENYKLKKTSNEHEQKFGMLNDLILEKVREKEEMEPSRRFNRTDHEELADIIASVHRLSESLTPTDDAASIIFLDALRADVQKIEERLLAFANGR